MKKIILILSLLPLLTTGYSQGEKDFRLGITLSYSSIDHLDLEPFTYKLFQAISPGVKIAHKSHALGVNYELISPTYNGPLKYGPFTALQRQFPKGISTFYRYTYFQGKYLSAFAGLDFRHFRYHTSSNGQFLRFSESKDASKGERSYCISAGPHAGLQAKWNSISIDLSANFSRAFFHFYDLADSEEASKRASLLVLNGGLTYWINK